MASVFRARIHGRLSQVASIIVKIGLGDVEVVKSISRIAGKLIHNGHGVANSDKHRQVSEIKKLGRLGSVAKHSLPSADESY